MYNLPDVGPVTIAAVDDKAMSSASDPNAASERHGGTARQGAGADRSMIA
jgi:hypothetical protein